MGVAILGRESLDTLEEMIRSRFKDVARKDVEAPKHPTNPHTEKCRQKIFEVVPVRELRSLELSFPCPDQTLNYTSQPGHYLAHLIGHEGSGSLLSLLKAKGWANGLCAGDYTGEIGTFGFFKISVDLSEDGLQHIDEITSIAFQYLNLLKKDGIQEWIFEECKDLYAASFQFMDKARPAGYCSRLSKNILIYPADDLLHAVYKLESFRPDLIQGILDQLDPELLRMTVIAKEFEAEADLVT